MEDALGCSAVATTTMPTNPSLRGIEESVTDFICKDLGITIKDWIFNGFLNRRNSDMLIAC